MRFMMLMIPGVYQGTKGKNVGEDFAPDAEDVAKMTKYNEELAKSGALLSLDGLHPMAKGARVSFSGEKPSVTRWAVHGGKGSPWRLLDDPGEVERGGCGLGEARSRTEHGRH